MNESGDDSVFVQNYLKWVKFVVLVSFISWTDSR